MSIEHPYKHLEGSRLWLALSAAIDDLVENADFEETTARVYIVGYLAKYLSERGLVTPRAFVKEGDAEGQKSEVGDERELEGDANIPGERRLYRHIEVWERLSEHEVACYHCLEAIPSGKFCVQSKDFYSLPVDRATHADFASQFLTLISEEPPDERAPLHESLAEAIRAHNHHFG